MKRGSSKEKGGSGAHDHSRHKIATHSKFPRHKITPKIQKLYLSMFYPSPSTKHAIRHIFEPIHSNPHKLHQDEFHTTKVDYPRDQGSLQLYFKNSQCCQNSSLSLEICFSVPDMSRLDGRHPLDTSTPQVHTQLYTPTNSSEHAPTTTSFSVAQLRIAQVAGTESVDFACTPLLPDM